MRVKMVLWRTYWEARVLPARIKYPDLRKLKLKRVQLIAHSPSLRQMTVRGRNIYRGDTEDPHLGLSFSGIKKRGTSSK